MEELEREGALAAADSNSMLPLLSSLPMLAEADRALMMLRGGILVVLLLLLLLLIDWCFLFGLANADRLERGALFCLVTAALPVLATSTPSSSV